MTMTDKTVAFLVSQEGIEQAELTAPWQAVTDAGATARLIAPEAGQVRAFQHLDPADLFPVDETIADAAAEDYTALVLPGGVANGDQLRIAPGAAGLVREFVDAGKPVAAICHGGWVLIEADAVSGRRVTSWPSLATDFRNAGASWADEEVIVDHTGYPLISSRKPDDLPAFCRELVAALDKA
jgi:protease I